VFVWNNDAAAVAAAHSVDLVRWREAFSEVLDRIAPRFTRSEPLRHAAALIEGLVSGLDRKNCWTIAEHRGQATPDGLQHLLGRAKWDADAVRDDLRGYVVDHFGDPGAILVVDETGDLKKGTHTVGTQRQYTGTAGRIENAQVAVYLTYAAPRGHALIDRALYLPRSWTDDPDRCATAGVPVDVEFATKPQLAGQMISRAVASGAPAAWVAGDEVYGADPRLRALIRGHGLGYVLQISANRRVPTDAGPIRVDQLPALLPALLPARAWQHRSAGEGSKGPRIYSWAWITVRPEEPGTPEDSAAGKHQVLIRRNDTTGELPITAAGPRHRCRWRRWSRLPDSGGGSRSPSRPPKAWSASTSTRSAAGPPGTGGPCWRCSPTPSSPSPPPPNATSNAPHHPRQPGSSRSPSRSSDASSTPSSSEPGTP